MVEHGLYIIDPSRLTYSIKVKKELEKNNDT